ncbi:MAG: hypothetical protein C0624_03765 [Desulfuromonas sp.]|nr:MAG: hypothetical protein C0624_03765 [Desulfuromonas sp.]
MLQEFIFYRLKHVLCAGLLVLALIAVSSQAVQARSAWYQSFGIESKQMLTSPSAVPGLIRALDHRDANIRKSAAKYLSKIKQSASETVPVLVNKIEIEKHPRVRAEMIRSVTVLGLNSESTSLMVRLLGDRDPNVRKMALVGLDRGGYRGSDFVAALEKMAKKDRHRKVRALAAKTLAKLQKGPITPSVVVQSKAPTPAERSPKVATTPPPKASSEHRYSVAVIIGNRYYANNNQDVPDVDYAHNDAQAIYNYVTRTLGYLEGNVIYLKDATQADLISTFGSNNNPKGKLFDWVRPNMSDVFIYYSGHGAPGLSNGKGYLLPVDANPLKVELNGYPLDTFYANLSKVPARSTTIILDACFSGVSSNGTVVRNASSISLKIKDNKPVVLKKTAVLTAAGLSEVASWDQNSEHGLFTSMFLQGIGGAADGAGYGNGDGKITLGEIKGYLQEEVSYSARRLYGRSQNPQVTGDPELVLFDE